MADPDPRRISRACAEGRHSECPREVYRIPPVPDASAYVPCEDPCGHPEHAPAAEPTIVGANGRPMSVDAAKRRYVYHHARDHTEAAAQLLAAIAAVENRRPADIATELEPRVRQARIRIPGTS